MIKNSLDKQYLDIAKDIVGNGNVKSTRNSITSSVFGRMIRHDMSEGFPIYTTKFISLSNVFTELKWFLMGRTDLRWLVERKCNIWVGDAYKKYANILENTLKEDENFKFDLHQTNAGFTHILSEEEFIEAIKTDDNFSELWGDLGVIYGSQWRAFGSSEGNGSRIDQVKEVIQTLKNDPNSRRIILNAWNASELDNMILPPCHLMFQCYTNPLTDAQKTKIAKNRGVSVGEVKDVGLSLMFYCRSQDYFLGTPYNTVSYGLLLTVLCDILGFEPVDLIQVMGDTHVYGSHFDAMNQQIANEAYDLPRLLLKDTGASKFWQADGEFAVDDYLNHLDTEKFVSLIDYKHCGNIKAPLIN